MRLPRLIISAFLTAVLLPAAQAQTFRHAGTEFEAVRQILVPEGKQFEIGAAEFHHQGLIADDGKNVLVLTADRKPVPTRVLQQGPGDFSRVAFQTAGQEREYLLFYGGKPPKPDDVPQWASRAGLLLEIHEYRQCNLNSFESVKQAFETSRPIGSGYVASVEHGSNPFTLTPAPFLSRYSGTLNIATSGKYGFLTSSEDCSFLLVDDQVIVAAPGRHGPEPHAKPGNRNEVELQAGAHKFEYYHAASGPSTMMLAVWEPSPAGQKPAPVAIPPAAFRADSVGPVLVGPPETEQEKLLPHFAFEITGSVPLPDNPQHLLGTQFQNLSPAALQTKSKILWDFGDGQTSDQPSPEHVYLRPGLYPVSLSIQRGTKKLETAYTLQIDQRQDRPKDLHQLDRYLPILQTYDPARLDAASLQQLVSAYLWKAELVVNPTEGAAPKSADGSGDTPVDLAEETRQLAEREKAAAEYLIRAVNTAKAAFAEKSAAVGDQPLFELAQLAAPIARDQLGDSRTAGQIWHSASQRISRPDLRAACQLEAADIALNDLLLPDYAKGLLDTATATIGQGETGVVVPRLHRVWGDYYAATGDAARARKSYSDADRLTQSDRSHMERIAWQGAHSRSTEHCLKTGRYGQAAQQLRAWQRDFPSEKLEGYMHLLFARYWAGRENYAAAIALANQILVVNPDSPYADRLLAVAAECEEKQGHMDRALATIESLLHDYPGSPMVPEALLMAAQYDVKSGRVDRALPRLETLLADCPDSPRVPDALLLAADCEEKSGHIDRALVRLQTLVRDRPDSRLVPDAQARMKRLESLPKN